MKRVRRCRIPGRDDAVGASVREGGAGSADTAWTVLNLIERSILPRHISLAGSGGSLELAVCDGRLCGMPRVEIAGGADDGPRPGLAEAVWRASTPSERQALLRGAAKALVAFCAGTPEARYRISPAPGARDAATGFSAIELAQAVAPDIIGERDGVVAEFWPMMKADQGWLLSAGGWPCRTSGPTPEDMDIDDCATAARALGKWRSASGMTGEGPTMIVATVNDGDSGSLLCLAADGKTVAMGSYRRTMLASILWAWRYAAGGKAGGDTR